MILSGLDDIGVLKPLIWTIDIFSGVRTWHSLIGQNREAKIYNMIDDNTIFTTGYDFNDDEVLLYSKIDLSTTPATYSWIKKITCSSLLCNGYDEDELSSGYIHESSNVIYTFATYGNPKQILMIPIDLSSGDVQGKR